MGGSNVWILGGFQSDFARNLTREGCDFADLTAGVVTATLEAAKIDAADIGVVHVGNAFGEMFAAQGHLGAMPASVVGFVRAIRLAALRSALAARCHRS